MKTVEFNKRAQWRAWLTAHHDRETEVWLIYYRKETGISSIAYADSLDEALCFGWVDSIIKKLDDSRYARKFIPRNNNSKWSLVNKKRVEQLIRDGAMTKHGLKKVEAARRSGRWDRPVQKPKGIFGIPAELKEALKKNQSAKRTFRKLAPTYRKQYLLWIGTAKQSATRQKRVAESIRLLSEGKKLGLK